MKDSVLMMEMMRASQWQQDRWEEVKKVWVIFIISGVVIALVATIVIAVAAWIIHKVSNAIIRDNRKLEKEEKLNKGE